MPSPSLTLLRTQSDERLVALAREGHERAFEAIVDRYRKSLLRAARRVLPEGRAEDALQQALLSAWTALQRGDDVYELRPWLYRIVHNASLNALRVSGYDYAELHEAARIADAGDDELERRAVVRQTLASLAALPERQREALIRTAISGDAQEDIARDLGLTDNALRQLLHRARVSMRTAATALTPMPLVSAAAAGSRAGGPVADRIAEAVAGGGASLTLAKAGTVAVLAGGALSGPAIVHQVTDRSTPLPAVAQAASPRHAERSAATAQPEHVAAPVHRVRVRSAPRRGAAAPPHPRILRAPAPADDRARHRSSGSDDSGVRDDGRSGSGSGRRGGSDDDAVSPGSGHEGPSGSGSPEPVEAPTREPQEELAADDASEGPGPAPAATPAATPEPEHDDS